MVALTLHGADVHSVSVDPAAPVGDPAEILGLTLCRRITELHGDEFDHATTGGQPMYWLAFPDVSSA